MTKVKCQTCDDDHRSRQPTYTASDSVLNGKPSVKSSSNNGKIGLTISSSPQREIFMVAYFNDGIDNNFDENMNLFSGSGTDGQYGFKVLKIMDSLQIAGHSITQ